MYWMIIRHHTFTRSNGEYEAQYKHCDPGRYQRVAFRDALDALVIEWLHFTRMS